ncbi:MAG: hypothetical protein AMXMBFR7_50140 [Planctomycetota bacterium]
MEPTFKKQLLAWAGIFLLLAVAAVLWKTGLLGVASQKAVDESLDTFREVERRKDHPRTIVLKSGKSLACKRVMDQRDYWGFVTTEGRMGAVRKVDVEEIVDDRPAAEDR